MTTLQKYILRGLVFLVAAGVIVVLVYAFIQYLLQVESQDVKSSDETEVAEELPTG